VEKEETEKEVDKMVEEEEQETCKDKNQGTSKEKENSSSGKGTDQTIIFSNDGDLDMGIDPNIVSRSSFQYSLYAYPILPPDY